MPLLEQLGDRSPDAGRYLHWGATTQDIMDKGLGLLGERVDRIEALTRALGDELAPNAQTHARPRLPGAPMPSRRPITFGGKLAVWPAS